jgi:hypothetical protein
MDLSSFLSKNPANTAVRAPTAAKPPPAPVVVKKVVAAAPVKEEPKTALGAFLKASPTVATAPTKTTAKKKSTKKKVDKEAAKKNQKSRGNLKGAAAAIYNEYNITEKATVYGVDADGDAWSEDEDEAAELEAAAAAAAVAREAEEAAEAAAEAERAQKRLSRPKSAALKRVASAEGDGAASDRPTSCALAFTPACEKAFQKLKLKRKHRFVIYHITGDGFLLDVESCSKRKVGPDALIAALAPNRCRFAVYDHEFTSHDGRKTSKMYVGGAHAPRRFASSSRSSRPLELTNRALLPSPPPPPPPRPPPPRSYFLFWAPAGAPAESKVHYSHQKHACKKLFKNIDEVRICDRSDLIGALDMVDEEPDSDEGSWDPDA